MHLYHRNKLQLNVNHSWRHCALAACRRKLQGTWSTVAHQFRKSPAVDNYARPVDNTLLCRVAGGARSGALVAFSDAGQTSWNSLPDRLRDPTLSSDSFRKLLKTESFASY